MVNHFILLFTLSLIVTVHLAGANYCEGQYTTNEKDIFEGLDTDLSRGLFGLSTRRALEKLFLGTFQDICICSFLEKLSVCMKVLQHKLKMSRPISFTVDPTESDCECRNVSFYGETRKNIIYAQKMYACPTTTVKYRRGDYECSDEEPSFFIGRAYHRTHMRIRFTDDIPETGAALIKGQLTGFDTEALNFDISANGHHTYRPDYMDPDIHESVSSVGSSSGTGLEEPLLRNNG